MERIICEYANSPIIFVAPHGYKGDDYNTDIIASKAAKQIGANCLINTGWQRHYLVDESNDRADCNNVNHVNHEVIIDEFLMPYKRMCLRAKRNFKGCLAVFIHGVSDSVRKTTGIRDLDMILGYGLGKPSSTTCPEVIKNKFLHLMQNDDINCCVGKSGGRYSGYSKNNMNQYWRKIEKDLFMNSIQLEIVRELRDDVIISELTAVALADAAEKAFYCTSFSPPSNFRYDSV
jgi:hypothetical protein